MTNDGDAVSGDFAALPGPGEAGHHATWKLPTGSGVDVFEGDFLGMSTTHRDYHQGHDGSDFIQRPRPGEAPPRPCSACRWSEMRIFAEGTKEQPGPYVLHRAGISIVPGEESRGSVERTGSAFALIELLAQEKRMPDGTTMMKLSVPSRRVLAEAAAYDEEIKAEYMKTVR